MLEKLSIQETNDNIFDDTSDEDGNEFQVLCFGTWPSWNPPKSALSWYQEISDVILKDKELESIKKDYTPP